MPIYEYECSNCHHQFELIQRINDAVIQQCPQCYQETVIRLVSPSSFRLKGTGWYATDYNAPKKDSSNEPAKAAPETAKVADKKEVKTDSSK